eukprot:351897-Chlamydomonas_euryale.AAC.1
MCAVRASAPSASSRRSCSWLSCSAPSQTHESVEFWALKIVSEKHGRRFPWLRQHSDFPDWHNGPVADGVDADGRFYSDGGGVRAWEAAEDGGAPSPAAVATASLPTEAPPPATFQRILCCPIPFSWPLAWEVAAPVHVGKKIRFAAQIPRPFYGCRRARRYMQLALHGREGRDCVLACGARRGFALNTPRAARGVRVSRKGSVAAGVDCPSCNGGSSRGHCAKPRPSPARRAMQDATSGTNRVAIVRTQRRRVGWLLAGPTGMSRLPENAIVPPCSAAAK